jgi:subtilisin family serine protease
LGAARPVGEFGDDRIDRILDRAEDCLITGVYHARRSLGQAGTQHLGFDDVEERLGLSRAYSVELSDPTATEAVVAELNALDVVESATVQVLSVAPFSLANTVEAEGMPPGVDPWVPHDVIHARQAHELEPGDEDVWVGLVDTGISLGHPEFQRKLLAGYDTVHLGMGTDFGQVRLAGSSQGDDFSPRDEVGHGSHVGGIVAAHGWRLPPGVSGRSMILPVRVLAAAIDQKTHKRVGVGALSDINAGLKVAVDLGADVLNLSFGTPASAVPEGPPPHKDVISYASERGCTMVAAMGNSGRNEVYYPAAYDEVIAVGSVDPHLERSVFSTTGDHIALAAPGENIISAGRHGYDAGSGTSYAAPFVSGSAALVLARARRNHRKLNGREVKAILMDTATNASPNGFGPDVGHGVLNVEAALRALDTALAGSTPPGRRL